MNQDAKPYRHRNIISEFVIPKCSSKSFLLNKGQILRVIAHEGKQVAGIRFLNANDYREQFSAIISVSLNRIEGIGGGKRIRKLYSKPPWTNVMLTVTDDNVGVHFMGPQCLPKSYELKGKPGHLSCADLFDECLKPYHLSIRDLDSGGVFNAFMPVRYLDDENGTMVLDRPRCEKGDFIEFRAEMNLLVAATSCPNEGIVNDFQCKGLKYQLLSD